MNHIKAAFTQDGSDAGFTALWDVILTEAEGLTMAEAAERDGKYAVRDYAIPAVQDKQLQRLLSVSPSRRNRKRWDRRTTSMHFLFYGPATYDDDGTS